ncbi:hypothetical protein ABPG74_001568 [Tetrahymena malaccensis]
MEIQYNGASATMKTKQGKRSNSNSKANSCNLQTQNNNLNTQNMCAEVKNELSNHEILLLIDIRINELNQLSNIYAMTFDQTTEKVIDFSNIEINNDDRCIKLAQAVAQINNILKKYSSCQSFFIVYPKKSIASVLFRIFRQNKIQVHELSFTNTFISLGQLMPSQFLAEEVILFNQLSYFLDFQPDDEIAQEILPVYQTIQESINRDQVNTIPKSITRNISQSVDLHGLSSSEIKQQLNGQLSNDNKSQMQISTCNQSIMENQIKQERKQEEFTQQQNEIILSSSSITNQNCQMQPQALSKSSSLLSSNQNTPPTLSQNQVMNSDNPIGSSTQTAFLKTNYQQNEQSLLNGSKNISSLFDLSNNIQFKSNNNQTAFTQNSSYSMQPENTIFSSLTAKRQTSFSVDSGSLIGGQSSLFSSLLTNNQAKSNQTTQNNISNYTSNNLFKNSSNLFNNINSSPLATIQEQKEKTEMSLERNSNEKSTVFLKAVNQKDIEQNNNNGCISSSSSICSNSTYSSNKFMNEQQLNNKGTKFSSQFNFFILVIKLIKQGFQFKKECIISFRINLTIEIKLKYGQKIFEITQEANKKAPISTNLECDQTTANKNNKMINENSELSKQQLTQELISSGYNLPNQNQQNLSKKQKHIQQQWAKQNLGLDKLAPTQLSVADQKQKIQENLIQRSMEIQQKLSKNEENKKLDMLFVIDFECNQPGYEIIEFPVLVIDLKKERIIDTFHTYVKPTTFPKINPYISKITGIQQKDVANAPSFVQVIQKVEVFLQKYKDYEGCILYDCDSDCNYMKSEFINKNYIPSSDVFFSYINLRNVFPLEISGGVINKSLSHAQQVLQMEFQGCKHKGIDDARNQALVCVELVKRGFNFTQFMIQPQFLKQDPKCCVKNNLFNLYEYNTKFLIIKLDMAVQEQDKSDYQIPQKVQPSCMPNQSNKYMKFTCFLTEKNPEINQVYRIKDSTFYFDFITCQASGSRGANLALSTHPRNLYYSQLPYYGFLGSSNTNTNTNTSSSQNFQAPNNVGKHQNYGKQENHKANKQIDEHTKQVEKAFYHHFSSYLKKYNIQRNQTAFVLLGFDKNEFSNFQKVFNLQQYEKELFFNEKIIYIDDSLIQFTGFLDVYKQKDPYGQRKNSACLTPYKRKRSMSDDLLSSQIKVNLNHPVQFQDNMASQNSQTTIPQRKNSIKQTSQSPMIKPASTTIITDHLNLNGKEDQYTILHKGDLQINENEKNISKTQRKRSGKDFTSIQEPKTIQNKIEKQQQQQQQQSQQSQPQLNQTNLQQNTTESQNQINQQQQNQTNLSNTSNQNTNSSFSKEQVCQLIRNDEFSINFVNFILVNRKKLQEYQDLAYHWQYINNKPK